MNISFKKRENSSATLRCVRADGSETWSNTPHPALVIHDLIHYVVETELGFRRAFYGLLAEGHDISSFSLPHQQRPEALQLTHLPVEAHQTEILVSLLQSERIDGVEYERFAAILVKMCVLKEVLPPSLSDDTVDALRIRTAQLCSQWQTLKENETLTLKFDTDADNHT